jgi:gamma-glutamyl hydrolase
MPVIGILSIPPTPEDDKNHNFSFIDTSYVKFLHGGGATVVPILFNSTSEEIIEQMKTLDGVFFTGGLYTPTSFERYYTTQKLLYKLVIEQNKTLWGTCLGFQAIADIVANESDGILGNYPAMNIPLPLNFTNYGLKKSKMFSYLSNQYKDLFSKNSFTENWHNYGIGIDDFKKYLEPNGYHIVSTNIDTNGIEFVSTYEHETYKIYATQWHPEANQYDPDPQNSSHIAYGDEATDAMSYIAQFIVHNARLSTSTRTSSSDINNYKLLNNDNDNGNDNDNRHMLQGHQSSLSNAIELYPVRVVRKDDDTAFQYYFN